MKDFVSKMKNTLASEKTFTTNGAVAYRTSGKELLDFLFAVTAMRGANAETIRRDFAKVFFENPHHSIKFIFWLRDCRGGNGERRIFRECMMWLAENKPEVAKAVISLIPVYGRYDDMWCLLDTPLRSDVLEFVSHQWEIDLNSPNSSLLGKWLPSFNASSPVTKKYAGIISGKDGLNLTPRNYRKALSRLRGKLDIVERKMTSKEWGEINYSTVPSQANIKYSAAFMRNDEERRTKYLEDLKSGKTKINAQTLQPHEVVHRYQTDGLYGTEIATYDEALEQLWNALPDITIGNTLVVRDGSGSMLRCYRPDASTSPLTVATGLAVYMGGKNSGIWKDKFITFSMKPQIIDLGNCENLRDKLVETYSHDECENTNIEAVMDLILQTAINNHCSQDEMPNTIVILSDMGFDDCVRCGVDDDGFYWRGTPVSKTLFEEIASRFKEAGYLMPRICFWNLSGQINNIIPLQRNELGVVLMSGFSIQLLHMVMSGKTDPLEAVLEAINGERYNPVEEAIKGLI